MNNFVEVRAEDLHRALALPGQRVELTYDPEARPFYVPALVVGDTPILNVNGSAETFTTSADRERLRAALPASGVVTLALSASALTANGVTVEQFSAPVSTSPAQRVRRTRNARQNAQDGHSDAQQVIGYPTPTSSAYAAKIASSAPVWAGIEHTLRISARAYGKPQVTRDPFTTHRFTIRVSVDLAFTFEIDGGATYVTRLSGTERRTEKYPALAGDDYFACMHRVEDCVTG